MSDEQDVIDRLNLLAQSPEARPAAQQALTRFQRATVQPKRSNVMNRKFVLGGVAALLLAIVAFSFPATRVLAGEFLGIFRVQKFAPISVSPQQLQLLSEMAEDGIYPGELNIVHEPAPERQINSLDEAVQLAGPRYRLQTVRELGAPNAIVLQPHASAELTINLEAARKLIAAVDMDPNLLPDKLDGATVSFETNDVFMQEWDQLTLIQTQSPTVRYPDGVDPTQIGEALLRLLGMSDVEAARLARNIDWASTLLLPVPQEFATFREAPIGETTGLALESVDGHGSALLWERYGVMYMLMGEVSADELIETAGRLSPVQP